jgi:hypothetical protein
MYASGGGFMYFHMMLIGMLNISMGIPGAGVVALKATRT